MAGRNSDCPQEFSALYSLWSEWWDIGSADTAHQGVLLSLCWLRGAAASGQVLIQSFCLAVHASTDVQSHLRNCDTGSRYRHLKLYCQLLGNANPKMVSQKCAPFSSSSAPSTRLAELRDHRLPSSTFRWPKLLKNLRPDNSWGL